MKFRFCGRWLCIGFFLAMFVVLCYGAWDPVAEIENILANRPSEGIGFLCSVKNETPYKIDVKASSRENIQDLLLEGSEVFIRCGNNYFAVVQEDGKPKIVLTRDYKEYDEDNPYKNKLARAAALFTVHHRFSYNLNDWLGFSHAAAHGGYFAVDPKSAHGDIVFTTKEKFEKGEQWGSCWKIAGGTLDNCWLQNRENDKYLYFHEGPRKEVKIIVKGVPYEDIWTIRGKYKETGGVPQAVKYGQQVQLWSRSGQSSSIIKIQTPDGKDNEQKVVKYGDEISLYMPRYNGWVSAQQFWKAFCVDHTPQAWEKWAVHTNDLSEGSKTVLRYGDIVAFKSLKDTGNVYLKSWGQDEYGLGTTELQEFKFQIFSAQEKAPERSSRGEILDYEPGSVPEEGSRGAILYEPGSKITTCISAEVFCWEFDKTSTTVTKKEKSFDNTPQFTQLALKDSDDSWGIDKDYKLYHLDGTKWMEMAQDVVSVSVSRDGDVWRFSHGGDILEYRKAGSDAWQAKYILWLDGKVVTSAAVPKNNQVAAYKDGRCFVIRDGHVLVYDGSTWNDTKFPLGRIAKSISVDRDGIVYVVDDKGALMKYDTGDKNPEWMAMDVVANFTNVFAKTRNDIWGANRDTHKIWHYYGGMWQDTTPELGESDYVACAVGFTADETEEVEEDVKVATTIDPRDGLEKARLTIEVVTPGQGGLIKAGGKLSFDKLPLAQEPRVIGICSAPEEAPYRGFVLNPLLGKGIAWFDAALLTVGKGTISFDAKAQYSGDVQLLFGEKPEDSYVWKVTFGANGNKNSTIVRSTGNKEALLVCENADATIVPGRNVSLWVSIDDGLVLAGSGEPGENVIMAWRDTTLAKKVRFIGFGTNKQAVEFANIQKSDLAINIAPVERVYTSEAKSGSLFRLADEGSLAFVAPTQDSFDIMLSPEEEASNAYKITLSSRGIFIKKTTDEKPCATITFEDATELAGKHFWVSYNKGLFFVGEGKLTDGKSLRLLGGFKDLDPIKGIRKVTFSDDLINKVAIATPIMLAMGNDLLYGTQRKASVGGSLTVLQPFEYRFSQDDKAVVITNEVTDKSYSVKAIPQEGAVYKFDCTIDNKGIPLLESKEPPTNSYKDAVEAVVKRANAMLAQGELEREGEKKLQEIEKAKKKAEAEVISKSAEASKEIGEALADVGAKASSGGPIGAIVGAGMTALGQGGILASSGLKHAAALIESAATLKQLEGETVLLKKEMEEKRQKFQADLAGGLAASAFRALDSYVFIDKKPELLFTSSSLDSNIQKNKEELESLIKDNATPTIAQAEKMVDLITHVGVIKDSRASLIRIIDDLAVKEKNDPGALIRLLFSAYNNIYLGAPDIKQEWLSSILLLAREQLEACLEESSNSFTMRNYFGEYVWIPQALPGNGAGLFTFEAQGLNDLFVCFASEDAFDRAIRNTHKEIYEVVIGGWDNKKSVIRTESLGRSVQEVYTKDNPNAKLNRLGSSKSSKNKQYWINVKNGRITVGRGTPGEGIFLDWTDPYPPKVKYIGLSCWNSHVTLSNLKVKEAIDVSSVLNKKGLEKTAIDTLEEAIGVTQKSAD